MSPDPLGGDIPNPQSLNRYAYVMNNPTNWTDPSGAVTLPSYQQLREESWAAQGSSMQFGSNWNEFDLSQIPAVQSGYALGVVLHPGPSGVVGGSSYTSMLGVLELVPYSQVVGKGFDLFGNLLESLGQELSSIGYQAETLKLQAKDVAQGLAGEFKNGGCAADFLDRAAGAPGPAPVGPQPSDVVEAAGAGWAWWYAAENTLIVPLRSSTIRGIMARPTPSQERSQAVPSTTPLGRRS